MTSNRIVRLIVSGHVQGVGFRAFVARRAGEHGLRGWVRNRRDGTVEAVIAGAAEAVAAVLADIGKGPRGGRVDSIETEELAAMPLERSASVSGFSVLPTA